MAEIAYDIAGTILEDLGSLAYSEIISSLDMEIDLKKLQDRTLMLQSLLQYAETKQNSNERLRLLIVHLKDVFNNAMDVLDDFECEILRRRVSKDCHSFPRKVRGFFSRNSCYAFRFRISLKVKQVMESFDEVSCDMDQFQLISTHLNVDEELHNSTDSNFGERMSYSFVNELDVICRDNDKSHIIDILCRRFHGRISDDNGSMTAIVGIGGLVKTTLAKLVYNDYRVSADFDLKLWVCVSFDFDFAWLAREIVKAREGGGDRERKEMSIDKFQSSLRGIFEVQKFLLVLDDMWNEDRVKWPS